MYSTDVLAFCLEINKCQTVLLLKKKKKKLDFKCLQDLDKTWKIWNLMTQNDEA